MAITTGKLERIEERLYKCIDCDTEFRLIPEDVKYPLESEGIRCNGHKIKLCPWCRPDSKPLTNGRSK